jgi:hypothetical protein
MKTTIIPTLLISIVISLVSAGIFGFIGYQSGQEMGSSIVYDASFEIGFVTALEENTEIGYQDGFREGVTQGILQGTNQISSDQLQSSRNEGFNEGRSIGFSEGFDSGFDLGTMEGIKQVISNYLINNRSTIKNEFEGAGYMCGLSNLCERVVFNDASLGERTWFVFDLTSMTHTLNTQYTSDDGTPMQQRVIIDYKNGEISAEWRARTETYSTPRLLYSWLEGRMKNNSTSLSNQEQLEFMLSWYSDVSPIADKAGISWVLTANRS